MVVLSDCRIVVADDSLLVRSGLTALLGFESDLNVVATASSLPDLLTAVTAHQPDVVLTDVRMPPTGTDEGIQAAEELWTVAPNTAVIVLSQYADPDYLLRLISRGSARRGYLLKDNVATPGELRRAIDLVRVGGSFIDPMVVETLAKGTTRDLDMSLSPLTRREQEVLAQLATGKSNAAVAAALFVGERAVEKHVNSIFSKLGLYEAPDVNRRVLAVLAYLAPGQAGMGE